MPNIGAPKEVLRGRYVILFANSCITNVKDVGFILELQCFGVLWSEIDAILVIICYNIANGYRKMVGLYGRA